MITEKSETGSAIAMDMAVTEQRADAPAAAEKKRLQMPSAGTIVTLALIGLLWASIGSDLGHAWQSDKALSHGPLVPLITLGLLWIRREELKEWRSASGLGLISLLGCSALFTLAVWADVEFIKALSLIGVALSSAWFLGGGRMLNAIAGPVGFLVFMIPWPTSLTERMAFPLQLLSSTYGSLMAGLAGLNVERSGVQITIHDHATPPNAIFSVFVAQGCSGLTSMTVLLALGYLICYFTPVKIGWRALLMALVVPLTLLCNSVRLTVILLVGAHFNKDLAMWAHDNEGPVLIFFCSIALMGLRATLMRWLESREREEEELEFVGAQA